MSDSFLVSTRKGLFQVKRGKKGWQVASADFTGDNVTLALHDRRDDTSYAALNHGHFGIKLHRRQGGGGWQEVASPTYPPKPEGLEDLDGWGKPVKWTTQMIWALEPGGEKDLWCGTMPGGLFRSRDRGATWELFDPYENCALTAKSIEAIYLEIITLFAFWPPPFPPIPQTGGRRDWPWEAEQTSSSKQVLEKSDSRGTG